MQKILLTDSRKSIYKSTVNHRRANYLPFGFGPGIDSFGFTACHIEPYRGYAFGNGRRNYSTTLNRFFNPDFLSPFQEGGLNGYAYAMQDPVNYYDPSGEMPQVFKAGAKSLKKAISPKTHLEETLNVRIIDKGIFTHDDFTKNGRRLNITAHSYIFDNPAGKGLPQLARIRIDTRPIKLIDADTLAEMVTNKIGEYKNYQSIRTIICYSGDPVSGGTPIGQIIATRTGLKTKAYKGVVNANTPPILYGGDPSLDWLRLNPKGGSDYKGRTYVNKFLDNRPYNPVYFNP